MLEVGSDEVRLYREVVRASLTRTRAAVMWAGFRYQLLRVEETPLEAQEAGFIAGLYKAGILVRC